MRARIFFFFFFVPIGEEMIWELIGKGRVMILFVLEHTLQILLVFFLHFDSNNRVILQICETVTPEHST